LKNWPVSLTRQRIFSLFETKEKFSISYYYQVVYYHYYINQYLFKNKSWKILKRKKFEKFEKFRNKNGKRIGKWIGSYWKWEEVREEEDRLIELEIYHFSFSRKKIINFATFYGTLLSYKLFDLPDKPSNLIIWGLSSWLPLTLLINQLTVLITYSVPWKRK